MNNIPNVADMNEKIIFNFRLTVSKNLLPILNEMNPESTKNKTKNIFAIHEIFTFKNGVIYKSAKNP